MTLLQVEELTSYWARHPPLHLLVAAYLGPRNAKRCAASSTIAGQDKPTGADVGSMLARLGPGFAAGDVHAGLSPVILDFAELRRTSGTGE